MSRVALVTGSTSGIGLAIARNLAGLHYNLIITGFGEERIIHELVADIKSKYNVEATYIYCDLAKPSDVDSLWSSVLDKYPGGIDVLVNCAGYQKMKLIEDVDLELWNNILAVMLTAAFLLTQKSLPGMRARGWGRIVNISSVLGLVGFPFGVAYCAAKHGIIGLTKVVAIEAAGSGVTCNAICPGYVNTDLMNSLHVQLTAELGCTVEEAKATMLDPVPSKTAVEPEQVAALVGFLCSDAASEMTGSNVVMDGGMTAR